MRKKSTKYKLNFSARLLPGAIIDFLFMAVIVGIAVIPATKNLASVPAETASSDVSASACVTEAMPTPAPTPIPTPTPEPTPEPVETSSQELEVKTYRERLYEKAKEMYMSGEWDGLPTILEDRVVSMSHSGYILFDGKIAGSQEVLDMPKDTDTFFRDIQTYECVPGHGLFAIYGSGEFRNYSRGNLAGIYDNKLTWKGFNPYRPEASGLVKEDFYTYVDESTGQEYYPMGPELSYWEYSDSLFLITHNAKEDRQYLYVFTDYDKPTIKLVSDNVYQFFWATGIDYLCYEDLDGQKWIYDKDGPVKVDDYRM